MSKRTLQHGHGYTRAEQEQIDDIKTRINTVLLAWYTGTESGIKWAANEAASSSSGTLAWPALLGNGVWALTSLLPTVGWHLTIKIASIIGGGGATIFSYMQTKAADSEKYKESSVLQVCDLIIQKLATGLDKLDRDRLAEAVHQKTRTQRIDDSLLWRTLFRVDYTDGELGVAKFRQSAYNAANKLTSLADDLFDEYENQYRRGHLFGPLGGPYLTDYVDFSQSHKGETTFVCDIEVNPPACSRFSSPRGRGHLRYARVSARPFNVWLRMHPKFRNKINDMFMVDGKPTVVFEDNGQAGYEFIK